MSKNKSLLIFTRKPEKGKVKTRLAKGVGKDKALQIYIHLLKHSVKISSQVNANRQVWYTNSIEVNDLWNGTIFEKHVQPDGDLGLKMKFAFELNFKQGYQKVVIIGTDLLDLDKETVEKAYQLLDENDVVFGPAEDGGYYLLGMRYFMPEVFMDIDWSTEKVLQQSLKQLSQKKVALLEEKNDIDFKEDALRHSKLKAIIDQ